MTQTNNNIPTVSTMSVAINGSSLASKNLQLKNISAAISATEAFINGKATVEQFGAILNMYNMVNAMISVPGVLKGNLNDFCIEICQTIKQINARHAATGTDVLLEHETEQINALRAFYIDIISNVSRRHLDRAEKIMQKRLKGRNGVTNLQKSKEQVETN